VDSGRGRRSCVRLGARLHTNFSPPPPPPPPPPRASPEGQLTSTALRAECMICVAVVCARECALRGPRLHRANGRCPCERAPGRQSRVTAASSLTSRGRAAPACQAPDHSAAPSPFRRRRSGSAPTTSGLLSGCAHSRWRRLPVTRPGSSRCRAPANSLASLLERLSRLVCARKDQSDPTVANHGTADGRRCGPAASPATRSAGRLVALE
jgi:hypothetical protein